MSASLEEIAASLVREFLSRKGLKRTLAKMDEELPRTPESISNRAALAKAAQIEGLMKRNKERKRPLQTMIEVIVGNFIHQKSTSRVPCPSPSQSPLVSTPESARLTSTTPLAQRPTRDISEKTPQLGVGTFSGRKDQLQQEVETQRLKLESPRSVTLSDTGLRPTTHAAVSKSARRGVDPKHQGFKPRSVEEWESDQQKMTNKQKHGTNTGTRSKQLTTEAQERERNPSTKKLEPKPAVSASKNLDLGDLMCEDLEDLDLNMGHRGMGMEYPGTGKIQASGSPISLETAKMLRELMFGSATRPSFNTEWRRQNFTFCDLPGLEYGLVQHKGGPCGVLACVQAFVLKHLFFCEHSSSGGDVSPEQRDAALVAAMVDILWRVGRERGRAIVALPPAAPSLQHHSTAQLPSRSYTPDHITEQAVLYSSSSRAALEEFISSCIPIEEGKGGCIHFLLSVLLTKGIDSIRSEMDDRESSLISTHSYCSQELVNLLLTSHAVSNVFDGTVTLDSGSATHKSVLRGVPEQSEIGFLSLFESYGSCIVGSHYKEPVYPIWVVCSESHFTVLFSLQRNLLSDWQLEWKFDLFYYDGLANQDEQIRLTIDTSKCLTDEVSISSQETFSHRDLVPPLQLCIQTKWRNATVDWNGTEPLL